MRTRTEAEIKALVQDSDNEECIFAIGDDVHIFCIVYDSFREEYYVYTIDNSGYTMLLKGFDKSEESKAFQLVRLLSYSFYKIYINKYGKEFWK